jgi:peroxiredoxin
MKKYLFPFILIPFFACINAGKIYEIGQVVKDFTLNDVAKKQNYKLSQFQNSKLVVLYFTSPQCPYAKINDDAIQHLSESYSSSDVSFIIISPESTINLADEDVIEYISNKKFKTPYLLDEKNSLCNEYGITKIPSAVVLRKTPDMFVLEYRGSINADVTSPTTENTFYLKTAINALLAKRPFSVTEGKTRGCDL